MHAPNFRSNQARRERALTGLLISGPALWFVSLLSAYALSSRACQTGIWIALLSLLGASAVCSTFALHTCARRLSATRASADVTLHSFAMISGVMLNTFSLLLTLGLCAALFTGATCD